MIEHLREVVTQVEAYAGLLCIDDQVDTILSMIKAESDFRPHVVGDDGRSHGIGQTLKEDFSRWRKFWRKRGVELGSFYELETQIAFCVAEFYDKLYQAQPKGSVWSAVRRYNGWDRRSLRYLKRVKQFRGKIFHRPDTGDEFVILIPCEAIRD